MFIGQCSHMNLLSGVHYLKKKKTKIYFHHQNRIYVNLKPTIWLQHTMV